jgi:hypothetical protein
MKNFELNLHRKDIPDAELIADLKSVAVRLGINAVSMAIYDQQGIFGACTVQRRFGSWNTALNTAGLELNNRINIPDEELFENLASIWQTLGRQPVGSDVTKAIGLSKFDGNTYKKRFGSWNKALVAFVQYVSGHLKIDHLWALQNDPPQCGEI